MVQKTIASCLLCAVLLLPASRLRADADFGRRAVGTSGAQFLKLGVNARAIAMGEAYSAVADGSDALYWNPAGLARLGGKALSLMHAVHLQQIFYDYASYAQPLNTLGTFGVGVQYLSTEEIDQTGEAGTKIGSVRPYDSAVTLGWARRFKEFQGEGSYLVGASIKWVRSRLIETADAGAADLGVAWNPKKPLWLAVGVQNAGAELKFKEESDPLPLSVNAGASWLFFKSLTVASDVHFPRDNNPFVSAGAEYGRPIGDDLRFAGRIGYNSRTTTDLAGLTAVSAGLGLGWKGYGLDFSWVPYAALGNAYQVSISAKF